MRILKSVGLKPEKLKMAGNILGKTPLPVTWLTQGIKDGQKVQLHQGVGSEAESVLAIAAYRSAAPMWCPSIAEGGLMVSGPRFVPISRF